MKTFVELITEVRQCIDQEDNKVLANIKDSMESTTVATSNHALGSYLIYDKTVYEVTTAISVGDTLVIYPATGYNIKVADDIMTMIEALKTENQTLTNKVKGIWSEGGKNLLPNNAVSQTINGVTFTVNSDGSVTCSGTASANAIFTLSYNTYKAGRYIGSKFADDSVYNESATTFNYIAYMYKAGIPTIVFSNEDKEFELSSDVENIQYALQVASGVTINKTVYPMIRLASITDDTYEPYARTNVELTGEVEPMLNILGAKNLLPNNLTTKVVNGVTCTVNSNGTVGITTGTGSATSLTTFYLFTDSQYSASGWKENKYAGMKLTGCPSGGGYNTYYLTAMDADDSSGSNATVADDFGSGAIIGSKPYVVIGIRVAQGASIPNVVTFKPMIRPASIADNTYVPHAMSNKEITDAIFNKYNDTLCIEIPSTATSGTLTISEFKTWLDSLDLPRNTKCFFHSNKGFEKTLVGTYTQSQAWAFLAFSYHGNIEMWKCEQGTTSIATFVTQ